MRSSTTNLSFVNIERNVGMFFTTTRSSNIEQKNQTNYSFETGYLGNFWLNIFAWSGDIRATFLGKFCLFCLADRLTPSFYLSRRPSFHQSSQRLPSLSILPRGGQNPTTIESSSFFWCQLSSQWIPMTSSMGPWPMLNFVHVLYFQWQCLVEK